MTASVHQLVPSAVPGDATTSHTLEVQLLLREMGCRAEVYALAVHPRLESRVRLVGELSGASSRDGYLLYQLSAYSELADMLLGRREQLAVNYHNITPPRFFWDYDRAIALRLRAAELQVSQLARSVGAGICDSEFNEADLRSRGFPSTSVAPVLMDLHELDTRPDPATSSALERSREQGATLFLCVGGIAPHKAQHDLVAALSLYRRTYDPRARLLLVGRTMSAGYGTALRSYVAALGLEEAVELAGGVTHEQLVAYYLGCDALLSASDHEGFCVPLIEAMHLGLPVVALGAGAVPSTVGHSGVLLEEKSPHLLSAWMWRVTSDPRTREQLVRAGRQRAERFALGATRARMRAVLSAWLDGATAPDAPAGSAVTRS